MITTGAMHAASYPANPALIAHFFAVDLPPS
jgi:hypothetical protein